MYVNSKWELKISAQNQSFWSNLCYKIIIIMGQNLSANKSCSSKTIVTKTTGWYQRPAPTERFRKIKINYRNSLLLNKGENMDTLGSLFRQAIEVNPLSLIRKPFLTPDIWCSFPFEFIFFPFTRIGLGWKC